MPYKVGAANLPANVKKAPEKEQRQWVHVWNSVWEKCRADGGKSEVCEARAFERANGVLRESAKEIKQVESADGTALEIAEETQAKIDFIITESANRELSDEQQARVNSIVEPSTFSEWIVDGGVAPIDSLIAEIQEARVVQTFDGVQYPRAAFAYAPDPEKPSTWKLPLWGPDMKPSRKRIAAAVAAFSSGGHRGQRVQIPASTVAAVKSKIRAALRKFGVKNEDMKPHIKEAQVRTRIDEVIRIDIEEATKERVGDGSLVPIRVLGRGFNNDESLWYSDDAIQSGIKVFEGVKMYANHPSKSEQRDRPEDDIWNWVANVEGLKVSESGNLVGVANIHDGRFKEKIRELAEAGHLQDLGVSIRANGTGVRQKSKGKRSILVESILPTRHGLPPCVDFVTEPGARGRVGLRESRGTARRDAEAERYDIDLIEVADFRELRPDLVAEIEESYGKKEGEKMAEIDDLKKQVTELEESKTATETERDALKLKLEEAEKAEAKVKAQAEIKELVEAEKELPDPSRKRVIAQFTEADSTEGVAEAIAAEKAYLAELTESGKVKDMGRGDPPDDAEKIEATLIENAKQRFIKQGFNEEDAERMAQTYMRQ